MASNEAMLYVNPYFRFVALFPLGVFFVIDNKVDLLVYEAGIYISNMVFMNH